MSLKDQIRGWMRGREDEFVEALRPLIAVDSTMGEAAPGAPFGAGPAKALEEALKLAQAWGFHTDNDDGYVGLADLNDLPDKLHILGHLDIVGIGEGWDTDPFTVVRDGDIIYGRGVNDDKGPVVAAMLAMRCVRELGLPLTGNVKLVMGTDEETGSRDIHHYYSAHPFAPNSVTPDSSFPVTNVEKAHYAPKFSASWQQQPQVRGHISSLSGGIRINVAPANCTAKLVGLTAAEVSEVTQAVQAQTGVLFEAVDTQEGVTIQAAGIQAHAARPDGGKNAITAMLQVLSQLPLADDAAAKVVRQLHIFFPYGDNRGKALGIAMEDEISGELTLTLSLLELNETGFWARFDSRDPLRATVENTQHAVEAIMHAQGWECTGEFGEGHYVDGNSEFIRTLIQSYDEFSGRKGYCESTGGGTYVHHIPGGVAFGPCEHDFDANNHGANERAKISQMLTTAEIYAAVIARVCG